MDRTKKSSLTFSVYPSSISVFEYSSIPTNSYIAVNLPSEIGLNIVSSANYKLEWSAIPQSSVSFTGINSDNAVTITALEPNNIKVACKIISLVDESDYKIREIELKSAVSFDSEKDAELIIPKNYLNELFFDKISEKDIKYSIDSFIFGSKLKCCFCQKGQNPEKSTSSTTNDC